MPDELLAQTPKDKEATSFIPQYVGGLIPHPCQVENLWLRQRNDELSRQLAELEKRVERLEARGVKQREF